LPGTTAAPASRTGCCATIRSGSSAPQSSTSCRHFTASRPSTRRPRPAAHWFFLIQPAPFPERLIGSEAEYYLRHSFGLDRDPPTPWIEPEAFAEYLRCFSNPETIRATCEEYRAGASIDLEHDRAERGRKIAMPLLVLWGEKSGQGSGYDVLGVWRDHAEDVRGHGIASGHFIPEEAPDAAYQALRDFFAD
jgi:haloacetate dehalogenase